MNIDKRAELHITTNVYYRYMINTELYNTYDAESYNILHILVDIFQTLVTGKDC